MQPLRAFGPICLCVFVVFAAVFASPAKQSSDYKKLLADKAPALVTVKFLLKMSMGMMGGGDQEIETEITGVMIDGTGLVLCSNSQLDGFAAMMAPLMRSQLTTKPTDFKVLIDDDEEGIDATLIARDRDLDLAWIRITEPREEPYAAVDFMNAATPALGDTIVSVRLMDKFFDRAAVIGEGRIGGHATKPRSLYVPAGGLASALGGHGLPVYTADGKVVGVFITQAPAADDMEGDPMAMLSSMGGMQDMMSALILPASEIQRATDRALATAEEE